MVALTVSVQIIPYPSEKLVEAERNNKYDRCLNRRQKILMCG
jgi:hypothetical protein